MIPLGTFNRPVAAVFPDWKSRQKPESLVLNGANRKAKTWIFAGSSGRAIALNETVMFCR